jgi:anaerobic selenocysteine-containing dehydrogenase
LRSTFTPLSSFTDAQARDNPILVALHHRMRYANVFINEARARRLGLKEGDLVEVWMEEHPDEKQQAFLSVSKVIHQDVLFSYHGLGKGLQKTTEKLQYAKKNGLTSTISVGSGFPRGLRALGVANADVFAWQGGSR